MTKDPFDPNDFMKHFRLATTSLEEMQNALGKDTLKQAFDRSRSIRDIFAAQLSKDHTEQLRKHIEESDSLRQQIEYIEPLLPLVEDARERIRKMISSSKNWRTRASDFNRDFLLEIRTLNRTQDVLSTSIRSWSDAAADPTIIDAYLGAIDLALTNPVERSLVVSLVADLHAVVSVPSADTTTSIMEILDRFVAGIMAYLLEAGREAIHPRNLTNLLMLALMIKAMYIDNPNEGLERRFDELIKTAEERLADPVRYRAIEEGIRLRMEPNTDSPILMVLKPGETVEQVAPGAEWIMVSATDDEGNTLTGYVKAELLERLPTGDE